VDRFAGTEQDLRAADRHSLPLQARQMHLDPAALAIEEGVMLKACDVEICAKLLVHSRQQIAIELGGDAGRIIVRLEQHLLVFDQINADDEYRARSENPSSLMQKCCRLMRLEITDSRPREKTGARQIRDLLRQCERTAEIGRNRKHGNAGILR